MTPDLFRHVAESNDRLRDWGWCDLEKALTLAAITVALRPNLAIEVGVYGGRSLQPVAIAMKHLGRGKIIGIDPWSKDASVADMTDPAHVAWWSHLDHERVYQKCIAEIQASGISDHVEIIRKKSDDVDPSEWIADIFHLDGSHEETAYRDTIRYAPSIRLGGICICDDINWSSGAPKRGVEWLLGNGFVQLYPLGTGAVFQRIR